MNDYTKGMELYKKLKEEYNDDLAGMYARITKFMISEMWKSGICSEVSKQKRWMEA